MADSRSEESQSEEDSDPSLSRHEVDELIESFQENRGQEPQTRREKALCCTHSNCGNRQLLKFELTKRSCMPRTSN